MGKRLFIAEKPSVAQEFAKALKINGPRSDGYIESDEWIITWCYGHLVTMSYPEAYDEKLKINYTKRWPLTRVTTLIVYLFIYYQLYMLPNFSGQPQTQTQTHTCGQS